MSASVACCCWSRLVHMKPSAAGATDGYGMKNLLGLEVVAARGIKEPGWERNEKVGGETKPVYEDVGGDVFAIGVIARSRSLKPAPVVCCCCEHLLHMKPSAAGAMDGDGMKNLLGLEVVAVRRKEPGWERNEKAAGEKKMYYDEAAGETKVYEEVGGDVSAVGVIARPRSLKSASVFCCCCAHLVHTKSSAAGGADGDEMMNFLRGDLGRDFKMKYGENISGGLYTLGNRVHSLCSSFELAARSFFPYSLFAICFGGLEVDEEMILLQEEHVTWLKLKNQAEITCDIPNNVGGVADDPADSLVTFDRPLGRVNTDDVEVNDAAPHAVTGTVDLGVEGDSILLPTPVQKNYLEVVHKLCPSLPPTTP